jgi:hypothetical protein
MNWAELKYWIADHLFEDELDEAFELGIKEGRRRGFVKADAYLVAAEKDTPKSKHPGLQEARKILKNLL